MVPLPQSGRVISMQVMQNHRAINSATLHSKNEHFSPELRLTPFVLCLFINKITLSHKINTPRGDPKKQKRPQLTLRHVLARFGCQHVVASRMHLRGDRPEARGPRTAAKNTVHGRGVVSEWVTRKCAWWWHPNADKLLFSCSLPRVKTCRRNKTRHNSGRWRRMPELLLRVWPELLLREWSQPHPLSLSSAMFSVISLSLSPSLSVLGSRACCRPLDIPCVGAFHNGETCAGCGALGSGFSRCGRCKMTLYCSVNCQKKHWKGGHKQQCSAVKDQAKIPKKNKSDREPGAPAPPRPAPRADGPSEQFARKTTMNGILGPPPGLKEETSDPEVRAAAHSTFQISIRPQSF